MTEFCQLHWIILIIAFDQQNYLKLHIFFSQMYPLSHYILDHYHFIEAPQITNIKGTAFSPIAWDECHEMTINKACKMAL